MFGPPGIVYIYLIYGMYHCLNLVTEQEGRPGAVLIRALEPLSGRDLMACRRGMDSERAKDHELCSGPGKLCAACGIDLDWNGTALGDGSRSGEKAGRIWLTGAVQERVRVESTPRIGIRQASERLYRFIDPESSCLSR